MPAQSRGESLRCEGIGTRTRLLQLLGEPLSQSCLHSGIARVGSVSRKVEELTKNQAIMPHHP